MKVKLNKYRITYRRSHYPTCSDRYYYVNGLSAKDAEDYFLSLKRPFVNHGVDIVDQKEFSFPDLKFINESQRSAFWEVVNEAGIPLEAVHLYNKLNPIERRKTAKLLRDLTSKSIMLSATYLADIFSVRESYISRKTIY